MTDERLKLFLADDQEIVLEGIKLVIGSDPSIEVVGTCGDGLQVVEEIQKTQPNVVVLDISLPGVNGLDLCRMITEQIPETAILMLSMNSTSSIISAAFSNGALGYITKESVAEELISAIKAVAGGEKYLGKQIPETVVNQLGL